MSPRLLRRGDTGDAVRDLTRRLVALGYDAGHDPTHFDDDTEAALRAFQRDRGLRIDGVCGPDSWGALVESGFALGDRLLYLRRPMLRGDDVAALQRRLNALGFDAGREDAILGPDTARALQEFQRNAGLAADGVCGPATLAALDRLGSFAAGSVAEVRERESLRDRRPGLDHTRVFVAADPGLETLADAVARELADAGARIVLDASGVEQSELAATANRYEADLVLVLRPGDTPGWRTSFFATRTFRSAAGERLALAIHRAVEQEGGVGCAEPEPCGRTYAILRETRMAAVVCEPCEAGDAAALAVVRAHSAELARIIARAAASGWSTALD